MKLNGLSSNAHAVLWVTASVGFFSLVFASGKFAGDIASPLQILFLRYIGGLITLLIISLVRGYSIKHHISRNPHLHFYRVFCGAFGGVAIIYSSANMPIVDATAIGLLDTVFLVLIGVFFLCERISIRHWIAIGVCCAGAVVVMLSKGVFKEGINEDYWWPAMCALLGALLIALESVMIKRFTQSEMRMTILLYANGFGIILLCIPAILSWGSLSILHNLTFLLLGPIAIAAQYMTLRGYQLADLSVVGPVNYTWLIFAAIIGFVGFGEMPTQGAVIGAVLIVFGGILLLMIRPQNIK